MKLEAYCPEWWPKTIIERVTVDRIVHLGPALIFSLTIHSDGVAEADADVYDGVNVNGKRIADLYCVDEAMAQLVYSNPIPVNLGIFVDIGTNCEAVTVHYLPCQP